MGRTGRPSPALSSLPKVVFEKIEGDVSTQPAGVHDLQARSYGYNDFSDFARPEHYVRHIEPLESDLARQVEYDMDEQDQEWLDAINAERRKEQLDKISYELFEIVMDRLEKEWFDLTKNIPKPDLALPSEDSTCAICDDSEGENSNAIVFCDGCNLAVHQDCYGVPYIPEGQWLCRKCTVSPENPVCILCPNEGGAFKQTTHGDWVHLLCAIWVPETRVVNEVFMEPVAGVEKISKQRWKLRCSICDIREGACIQCAKTSCFLAFHATCARKERLLLSMKSTQGSEPATLTSYCERHLPKEQQEARASALATEESLIDNDISAKSNKSARAYAKTYQTGPPLVPALIVNRIMQYVAKVTVRKKAEFVLMLCRYWSLKREARRGAPLLKRLHLEPWTAVAGTKVRTDQEKLMKLEQLRRLRSDLLSLRLLTELCRKRESRKYRQAEIVYEAVAKIFFPHQDAMRRIFDRIVSLDKQEFFRNPVSKQLVPDYYDIVTKPMCWSVIEAKLDGHEYWDVRAFKDDVELVIDNALLYNQPDSAIYKAASRLKKNVRPSYEDLEKERVPFPEPPPCDFNAKAEPIEPASIQESMDIDDSSSTGQTSQLDTSTGDLEPPLDVLELLESPVSIEGDLNIEIKDEPLASLFKYEIAKPKISLEPVAPPPPKPKKAKRDRKAEYERAKAKKAAAAAAAMATAAVALTLLNGNHHAPGIVAPQNGAQPHPQDEERPKVAQVLQTPQDDPSNLYVSKPECITIDTTAGLTQEFTRESENVAGISPTSPRAERPFRKKRPSITLPGQSELPPMVSDVDNRDSFKMFDAGWILPPEQRRRGRPPLDRSIAPPPRKKARTEQGPSRLSISSTLTPENQTLQTSPQQEFSIGPPLSSASSKPTSIRQSAQPVHEGSTPKPIVETAAHTDTIQSGATDRPASDVLSPVSHIEPALKLPIPLLDPSMLQTKIVESANGTIIIEELDTPAIRRAKNQKRKEEKRQEMLRRNSVVYSTAPIGEPPGAPSKNVDSELSSLSEFGSELTEESGKSKHKRKRGRKSSTSVIIPRKAERENLANVSLGEGEKVEGGTLVWAKADSYPWWPAVIFEDDDPDVPRNILQGCREAGEKRKMKLHILRFFDKNQSWQYLAVDRLMLLGEDPELDEEMQSATSRRQRWKSANVRRDCCDAYKLAMSEMETGSDGGRGAVVAQRLEENVRIDNL